MTTTTQPLLDAFEAGLLAQAAYADLSAVVGLGDEEMPAALNAAAAAQAYFRKAVTTGNHKRSIGCQSVHAHCVPAVKLLALTRGMAHCLWKGQATR